MKKLTLLVIQTLIVVSFVYTQKTPEKVETYKIAYVNFIYFDNGDKGIVQLSKAQDAVYHHCYDCSKELLKKRETVILSPVLANINKLLSEIENQNDLKILKVENQSKSQSILVANKNIDLTEKFISFYNAQANKQKTELDFTVPKSKIGVIHTRMFFDNLNGIKSFAEFKENNNSEYICGKTNLCQELGKAMQAFAEKNEFGIILDSSKELPLELKDLKTIDITEEFISEYNSNK